MIQVKIRVLGHRKVTPPRGEWAMDTGRSVSESQERGWDGAAAACSRAQVTGRAGLGRRGRGET